MLTTASFGEKRKKTTLAVSGNYGPLLSSCYVTFKHVYAKKRGKAKNITDECYAGFFWNVKLFYFFLYKPQCMMEIFNIILDKSRLKKNKWKILQWIWSNMDSKVAEKW